MASQPFLLEKASAQPLSDLRVYTICHFDAGLLVPRVKLFDGASDEEAIAEARAINPWSRCEIWDRHRLVATIRPRAMA